MGIESINHLGNTSIEEAVTEALKEGGKLVPEGFSEHPSAGDLRGLARTLEHADPEDLRNTNFVEEQFDRAGVRPGTKEYDFFQNAIAERLTIVPQQTEETVVNNAETESVSLKEAFEKFDQEAFESSLKSAESVDELIKVFDTHAFPIEYKGEVKKAIPVELVDAGETIYSWRPSDSFARDIQALKAELQNGRTTRNEGYFDDPASAHWFPDYLHREVNRVLAQYKI